MTPFLSVLITYHNEAELLSRCLNSFKGVDFEILVYDDASAISCEPFIPEGLNVRVIRGEKNIGPARARNRLLSEARGEFVHFHDADDWVMPTWGEEVSKTLRRVDVVTDVVISEVSSFRNSKLVCEEVMELRELDISDPIYFAISHFILVPSVTLRKSLAEKIGGYPPVWQSEDFYFHLRMLLERPRLSLLKKPLVGIDLRTQSRSQNLAEVWNCTLEILKKIALELEPKYHQVVSEKAHEAGSVLWRCGMFREGRAAFGFARTLGRPQMMHRSLLYRLICRISPSLAETIVWIRNGVKNVVHHIFVNTVR